MFGLYKATVWRVLVYNWQVARSAHHPQSLCLASKFHGNRRATMHDLPSKWFIGEAKHVHHSIVLTWQQIACCHTRKQKHSFTATLIDFGEACWVCFGEVGHLEVGPCPSAKDHAPTPSAPSQRSWFVWDLLNVEFFLNKDHAMGS